MANPPRTQAVSPFTSAELAAWRQRLDAQRQELLDDIAQLGVEADEEGGDGSTDRDATPPAEVTMAELAEARATVALIDQALNKIAGRGPLPFGLCEETGGPIERERLELLPWTPLSAAGARQRERRPSV